MYKTSGNRVVQGHRKSIHMPIPSDPQDSKLSPAAQQSKATQSKSQPLKLAPPIRSFQSHPFHPKHSNMQLSTLFAIFALGMTATALPTVENVGNALATRHDGEDHTFVCCNRPGKHCKGPDEKCPPGFLMWCCSAGAVTPVSSLSMH